MSGKYKGNSDPQRSELNSVISHARKVFKKEYRKTHKASVLKARDVFIKALKSAQLSPKSARDVLDNPEQFNKYLNAVDYRRNSNIYQALEKILDNTSPKAALEIAVVAGLVTGLIFAVAAPLVTEVEQPFIDKLFHKNAKDVTAAPANTTTINNYYYNITQYNNTTVNNYYRTQSPIRKGLPAQQRTKQFHRHLV